MSEDANEYQIELLNKVTEILKKGDQVEEKDLREYWQHDLTIAIDMLHDVIDLYKAPNEEAEHKIMNRRR